MVELYNADATRSGIMSALRRCAEDLQEESSLLIYYAGHGEYDPVRQLGCWRPAGSSLRDQSTWISNDEVLRYLDKVRSRHVLLISDSCFSGTFFQEQKGGWSRDLSYLAKAFQRISREAMTSGADEPVPDSGSGGHSPFNRCLVAFLEDNDSEIIDAQGLHTSIRGDVSDLSDRLPRYGRLHGIGDRGGHFLFVKEGYGAEFSNTVQLAVRKGVVIGSTYPDTHQLTLDDIYEIAQTDVVRLVSDSRERHKRFNRDVGKYLKVLHTDCPQDHKKKAWSILLRDCGVQEGAIQEGDILSLRNALGITPLKEERSGIELVWVPPGSFDMGSPGREAGRAQEEGPVREVALTKGFWLSSTPVTQLQYSNVARRPMTLHPDCAVASVNWNEATRFCETLAKWTGDKYRLPTEAEWEYACRAFAKSRFNIGNDDSDLDRAGWYEANSGNKSHPVGQKEQNAWGLFDMHGNVWEWCSDWYSRDYYEKGFDVDPQGPESGGKRVVRGGCWSYESNDCRCAKRLGRGPSESSAHLGFRVVREE